MKIYTNTNFGYETQLVEVETDFRNGHSAFDIIGLADVSVRETRDVVKSAIEQMGIKFPQKRILTALSPADLEKKGAKYDLPIALSILATKNKITTKTKLFAVGGLDLHGKVFNDVGILASLECAKENGIKYAIVPSRTKEKIPIGIKVCRVDYIARAFDAIKSIGTEKENDYFEETKETEQKEIIEFPEISQNYNLDIIQDCNFEKYAMAVAVSGHHNIIFSGAFSTKRTMLVQHFEELLPKLLPNERSSVERIYSLCGLYGAETKEHTRPFRIPHQTASIEGMFGGGVNLRPGEVSLAHNGVLVLDEVTEFKTSVLRMFTVSLGTKNITLARAGRSTIFPANFQLVMTTNPCPCGNFGKADKICLCSLSAINNYWKKVPASVFARIEIKVDMDNLDNNFPDYSLDELRRKIKKAWKTQFARQGKLNGRLFSDEVQCNLIRTLTNDALNLYKNETLSECNAKNLLTVARTVADMEEHENIENEDMEFALKVFQGLDKVTKILY